MEEVERILKGKKFDKIGCQREPDEHLNTHQYQKDVYYMHFFLAEDSLFYIYLERNYCICIYEIPDDLVNTYYGKGYYPNRKCIRDGQHCILEEVEECAIPSQLMDFSYLRAVYVLNSYPIYEDYLNGTFPYFLDEFYTNDEQRKKLTMIFTD